ncbi:hypothetical protein VNO77_02897 [Canavalia gladiata]|uniref:Uncharacterized protein n=1 Tax=Canavalia gladiata TaxID=3824 RepID=A0AAN9MTS6_CANGL
MVSNTRRCFPLELRLHLMSPTSFCLGCCFSKGLIECGIFSLALCLHDEVHVKFVGPEARLIYSFERYGATPLGSEYASGLPCVRLLSPYCLHLQLNYIRAKVDRDLPSFSTLPGPGDTETGIGRRICYQALDNCTWSLRLEAINVDQSAILA